MLYQQACAKAKGLPFGKMLITCWPGEGCYQLDMMVKLTEYHRSISIDLLYHDINHRISLAWLEWLWDTCIEKYGNFNSQWMPRPKSNDIKLSDYHLDNPSTTQLYDGFLKRWYNPPPTKKKRKFLDHSITCYSIVESHGDCHSKVT